MGEVSELLEALKEANSGKLAGKQILIVGGRPSIGILAEAMSLGVKVYPQFEIEPPRQSHGGGPRDRWGALK